VFPNGVFSSHAIDELVARLDNPMTAAPKASYAPLVLVGGASQKTAEMTERLANIIPHRETIKVTTIPEIIDLDLQPGTSFIVLAELDKPTFAALDDEMLDALQTLFNTAQHVLWVKTVDPGKKRDCSGLRSRSCTCGREESLYPVSNSTRKRTTASTPIAVPFW
jgi:hypothetical protein